MHILGGCVQQLRPSEVNGVMRYRPGLEFHTDKVIHKSKNSSCSVYLCHDIHTKKKFVCKKVFHQCSCLYLQTCATFVLVC